MRIELSSCSASRSHMTKAQLPRNCGLFDGYPIQVAWSTAISYGNRERVWWGEICSHGCLVWWSKNNLHLKLHDVNYKMRKRMHGVWSDKVKYRQHAGVWFWRLNGFMIVSKLWWVGSKFGQYFVLEGQQYLQLELQLIWWQPNSFCKGKLSQLHLYKSAF